MVGTKLADPEIANPVFELEIPRHHVRSGGGLVILRVFVDDLR